MPPKKRSRLQQAHSIDSLNTLRSSNKENDPGPSSLHMPVVSSGESGLKHLWSKATKALNKQTDKVKVLQRSQHNNNRKISRGESSRANLKKRLTEAKSVQATTDARVMHLDSELAVALEDSADTHSRLDAASERNTELQRQRDLFRMRAARAPDSKAKAIHKAVRRVEERKSDTGGHVFHVMEHGIITDSARGMVRDLVAQGVPIEHIDTSIKVVADCFGVEVRGSISTRSAGRFVAEGGIMAKVQIADELGRAKAFTDSSDSTSHNHIGYNAPHTTMNVPVWDSESPETTCTTTPVTRSLGITSETDHTSESQFEDWKRVLTDILDTFNESLKEGSKEWLQLKEIVGKLMGCSTDHAADQKKLVGLLKAWKRACDRELRGERWLSSQTSERLIALLTKETEEKIEEAGGPAAWEALSEEEQSHRNLEMHRRVCIEYGNIEFATLSDEEKLDVEFFIWAGCCMHKEMNSVKGGNARMMAWWKEQGLTPPVPLMNRDNAAAAVGGSSAAKSRAQDVSEGGAVKLASLAGGVLNHKDDKKGQQDVLQYHLEEVFGFMVRFPDTSNTRYQCYCEAAAELLVHLDFYLAFFELVRDKKTKVGFNHMEANVYKGLTDIPTRTELAVLTLYSQAISHPYMRHVRGPGHEKVNILDLGPLHENVKTHIRSIISNPDLLISTDAHYASGSLDGNPWHRPDAFYAVQCDLDCLPHLRGALVAFCEGALETWERFTSEFVPGGLISTSTPAQRASAFMNTTNDHNEGALGSFRVAMRRAPRMSLHQYNARTMYKKNGTAKYIKYIRKAHPERLAFLKKKARQMDSSRLEYKRRKFQVNHNLALAAKNREKANLSKAKKAKIASVIDAVSPRLDVAEIEKSPGTNAELELQLDWHRRHDSSIPKKSVAKTKNLKIQALVAAVGRYNTRASTSTEGVESEALDVDMDEIDDDGMDSDEFDPGY